MPRPALALNPAVKFLLLIPIGAVPVPLHHPFRQQKGHTGILRGKAHVCGICPTRQPHRQKSGDGGRDRCPARASGHCSWSPETPRSRAASYTTCSVPRTHRPGGAEQFYHTDGAAPGIGGVQPQYPGFQKAPSVCGPFEFAQPLQSQGHRAGNPNPGQVGCDLFFRHLRTVAGIELHGSPSLWQGSRFPHHSTSPGGRQPVPALSAVSSGKIFPPLTTSPGFLILFFNVAKARMGRSTRQCGAQRGDGRCKSPPAARKVVPELPAGTTVRQDGIPPLRENERGRRPARPNSGGTAWKDSP